MLKIRPVSGFAPESNCLPLTLFTAWALLVHVYI